MVMTATRVFRMSALQMRGATPRAGVQLSNIFANSTFSRAVQTVVASDPTRTITMVKKLTADGTACRKCLDIEARLEKDGLAQAIDRCIYMDPNTPGLDEGTKLAAKHDVKVAPFFVVNTENGDAQTEDVYTVYMKMKRQVFNQKASVSEANTDVALSIF